MNDETKNEFLQELEQQTDNTGLASEDGNPFGASLDVEEEEVKEEEKPLPFHRDPKVQRYVEKQIEKALKDVKPTEVQQFIKDTGEEDSLADVLTRIIGNDTPEKLSAIKDFRKELSRLEEKGAEKALAQISRQAEEERQAEAKATQELEQGFEDIEETFNVDLSSNSPIARKTRNEFVDFIKRVSPKDSEGNVTSLPDLEATFELFQDTRKKPDNSRAKQLADRSMSRSSDASNVPVQKDSSWEGVNKFLDSLRK